MLYKKRIPSLLSKQQLEKEKEWNSIKLLFLKKDNIIENNKACFFTILLIYWSEHNTEIPTTGNKVT